MMNETVSLVDYGKKLFGGGCIRFESRVKQTGKCGPNLGGLAEFPLKHGLGGCQSLHSAPVFLPKLLVSFREIPLSVQPQGKGFSDPKTQ